MANCLESGGLSADVSTRSDKSFTTWHRIESSAQPLHTLVQVCFFCSFVCCLVFCFDEKQRIEKQKLQFNKLGAKHVLKNKCTLLAIC